MVSPRNDVRGMTAEIYITAHKFAQIDVFLFGFLKDIKNHFIQGIDHKTIN